MIFITGVRCVVCGRTVTVQEAPRSQYPATGDLFIDLSDPAHPKISANCKNSRECQQYRTEHAVRA
jgi:hypothetical protein